jgi:DNA-binding response OmpR family regulator
MKILLLEDDIVLNEIIEEHLVSQGYFVMPVYNGYDAEEILYKETFDLLLFDVNVPGIDGFDLLKNIRKNNIATPTIFLTSLDRISDIEKGFSSGCDDYIKKPFELKELDIRIKNLKRLFNILPNNIIKISNDLYLDTINLVIKRDNVEMRLTKKECQMLLYLINSDNIVSTEEFSVNVWSYDEHPDPSTVRTYIKNIRKIIGEEAIANIRGVGYKFNK